MIKKLDFNALEQPVLEITLRDKEQTVVRVTAPTEELVERFTATAADIQKITTDNNGETIQALYGLIADLINNNLDELKFTADSLRKQYNMKLYDTIVFVKIYLEFIRELESAKN